MFTGSCSTHNKTHFHLLCIILAALLKHSFRPFAISVTWNVMALAKYIIFHILSSSSSPALVFVYNEQYDELSQAVACP